MFSSTVTMNMIGPMNMIGTIGITTGITITCITIPGLTMKMTIIGRAEWTTRTLEATPWKIFLPELLIAITQQKNTKIPAEKLEIKP